MEHSVEESVIIAEFVNNSATPPNLLQLKEFIDKNLGVRWNIRDSQTRKYLTTFLNKNGHKSEISKKP